MSSPLEWVERLLEPSLDREMLIEAAQVFSPSHYSDVVDERNIVHLCGYPLCDNPRGEQPRQKYHISVSQKKVFDLTERKKFCSSECYRASNFYVSQLSSLSVAAREGSPVAIKFLQAKPCEVDKGISDAACAPMSGGSSTSFKGLIGVIKEHPDGSTSLLETTSQMDALELRDESAEFASSLEPPRLSSVGHLLHAMSSWCTADTHRLLLQLTSTGPRTHPPQGDSDCRGGDGGRTSTTTADAECGADDDTGSIERELLQAEDAESVVLPPIHSSAHSQLQMTIFIQQLKRNLPSVTAQLNVSLDTTLSKILPLVRTFRFSKSTVMFKPSEWNVIILFLLHIVNPERGETVLHSTTVQDWLKRINVTIVDFKLMLQPFQHH